MSNLFFRKNLIIQQSKTLFILTLGLSFLNPQVLAQSSNNERWYQIELLIFSQTLDPIDTGENWPTDIALAYPPGTVLLSSAEAAIEAKKIEALESLDQTVHLETEITAPSETVPLDTITDSPNIYKTADVIGSQPFIDLSEQELTLTAQKSRLQRNNRFRVLKHLAWRQPIAEKATAKSVVITGGDQFGEHYELEGTISVSASRYLHLETNLWLTQFYPNLGIDEATNLWPDLPVIPKPANDAINFPAPNNLSFNANAENQYNQFGSLNSDANTTATFSTFSGNDSVLRKPYLIDQIILLSQSRRMRSNELHYLDHPAIGVLAKITPWQPITVNKNEF